MVKVNSAQNIVRTGNIYLLMLPSAQTKKVADYKDLILYQKSFKNTITLFKYYKNKSLLWIEKFIVQQLLRALSSVGANIVEGYGRFLSIAKGSSLEVEYWIDLLLETRPQDQPSLDKARSINTEVIKMITTIHKNLKL